ncbi:hypothetical protein ABZW44_22630 [Streptomyces mirabilis]|uniref:hypothetical protein n=1 Tax=Streptomyces mirabilis TaxID=68239 RepID=UPI0033BEBD77
MTEQTAAIEVWARMLCAADVHVHGSDHPTWQQLVGEPGSQIRDDYRKAAAWLLPRMTVTAPPAVPAVVPPADQADVEAYRLALSAALGLGTGANWEAIRDRSEDLVAEVGQLTETRRRLGLMVDEYGQGASHLGAKVKRARDLANLWLKRTDQLGQAGRLLTDALDLPAAELRRVAGETQQPETPSMILAEASIRASIADRDAPAVVVQPAEPADTQQAERVVAWRSLSAQMLRCLEHVPPPAARAVDCTPVTSDDLPDGGICTHPDCGVDVLIPQEA